MVAPLKHASNFSLRLTERIPQKEYFAPEFLQGMVDRIATSHFKYGEISANYPDNADALESMKERLKLYAETGNTENLIDAANFLMIEFMYPAHKKAHFRSQSSKESPGLVRE